MKRIIIGFLLCLSVSYLNAYTHRYVNKTNDEIAIWVRFTGCEGNVLDHIKPGESRSIEVGGCCVNRVEACLKSNCKARVVWTGSGRLFGFYCGNGTWNILSENTCCFFE